MMLPFSRKPGAFRNSAESAQVLNLLLWAAWMGAGCQSIDERILPAPLSFPEQQARILDIAPEGTPRDQAVAQLNKAGISGTFGVNRSIYYCDLWDRRDGTWWHLDAALLFDERGRLYEVRPGEVPVGYSPRENAESAASQASPTELPGSAAAGRNPPVEGGHGIGVEPNRPASMPPEGGPAPVDSPASDRDDRRTPFADPADWQS